MYPVYLITCNHPSYLKPMRYVGVVLTEGKTVGQRFSEHIWLRGCSSHYLHRAIKKYGKEFFTVQQIDAGKTPEQALKLEQMWVFALNTKAPNGYNLTDGGEGKAGYIVSEETIRKMSVAQLGERNPQFGKKQTAEQIQHRVTFLRGRVKSAEERAHISKSAMGHANTRTAPVTDESRKRMRASCCGSHMVSAEASEFDKTSTGA